MLAGVVNIGGLLIGPRQSKLGRRVQRIELQRVLEGIDGLRKLLGLHGGCPQEIPCVGVVRINLDYVTKRVNRGLSIAGILVEQSEVVPRVRIPGILLERIFERRPGFVNLLQVQEGDAFIQPRDRQFGIKLNRLLECLESLLEKLLVHVGGAEIVHARSLNRIGGLYGALRKLSLRGSCEQAKRGQEYAGKGN